MHTFYVRNCVLTTKVLFFRDELFVLVSLVIKGVVVKHCIDCQIRNHG